jgi:predicted enzyme related to lactoylglutathione lyase
VCIIDEAGKICREVKVPSHPEDLAAALNDPAWRLERIGLEGGAVVAMAVRRPGGSRIAGGLH